MADVESKIVVNIDTTAALAELKALQRQISAFHTSMAKTGAAGSAVSANLSQNLINSINGSGKFYAEMTRIKSTTEAFNTALAKNQFSMKEYFRYAGAATTTFGRLFKQEHETINKVARENVKTLQTQYIKMGRDAQGALKAISVRPLALDMNNLQTQTALAAQKQALLNQLLRQGSTNLLNFGKNTQWAGRQLMVGFTVPLMYFGSVAGKTFMQLEEQAIRFKRVYGDMFTSSADATKALKDVQLLANEFTKYGVAVADTMKMAADVAATGKTGADLMAQVQNATKLAVLGGIDQQKSLDTIISLTSTFGIAAGDLASNIDFLNAVENQTILNIDDLTTAIPKAAPVIKQLGGDVKDLAFFMTAMREGGIDAAQGANAIKSALASMINPTKAARDMLSGFGIDLTGIVNADKGNVKKMVVDLATALNTLDPLNRAQAIEKMFGKFQFARVSTLFQNVIQQGSQAQTVLGLTKATTEELAILSERELSKVSESPMYKFKKEIQDLKTNLAPIGGEFIKALTPVIKFFGGIFDKFNNLGDGTKKFVVLLTTLVAGLGPILLMSFGLLANGIANIIKLFVGVKSLFNGVGKSTAGLGEQTNYLTQQQMEAAAVAASLDQAHQRLQQRFTAEAESVGVLTAAYLEAITAQRQFSMAPMPTGFARPPMKLATGIVSVPGPKGAGDVVPAMLSPGESVIPAKQSQKYAPLLGAIAADKVPGYMAGNLPAYAHAAMPFTPGSAQYIKGIQIAGLEKLAAEFPQFVRVVSNLVAELPQKLNVAMQKGTAKVADFQKAWDGRSGKFSTAAKLGGLNMGDQKLTGALAKLEAEVGKRTIAMAQASAIEKDVALGLEKGTSKVLVSDELFANATNQVIEEFMQLDASSKQAATALRTASMQVGQVRASLPTAVLREGLASGTFTKQRGMSQRQSNIMYGNTNVGRESGSKAGKFYPANPYTPKGSYAKEVKVAVERAIAEALQGIKQGAAEALKTASPSKEMRTVGQQGGQGLILGAKDQLAQARVAGEQIGAKIKEGAISAPMPPGSQARNRTALYGTGPVDAEAKSIRRQLEAVAKRQLAESKKQLQLDEKISQSKQALYGTTGEITADMRIQRKLRESQERQLAQAARQRIAEEEAMAAQNRSSRIKQAIADRFKLKATNDGAVAASPRGGKLAGGLMAASMVAMMGSMAGGTIGDISQKLMMPLMALTMIVPMLNSAFGLLAVGIGVVVASYVMNRMAVDKAGNAAIEFADKVKASNAAIIEFGKFAGKVSATEIMDRRRKDAVKQYQTVTGKTTFGEAYVGGEAGQALVKTVGQNIGQNGMSVAGNDLFRQLSMSVAAGTLTTEEARSIALNVGDALGNQAFGIQVNARLTELLGPNGENLMKDPLLIKTKMIDATNRDLQASNSRARNSFGYTGNDTKNVLGYTAAGAGAGAVTGAIAGAVATQAIAAATLGAGEVLLPVLTGIGAVAGTIIGGVGGYFKGRTDRGKRIAASTGADAAMQKIALEDQQQMQDALELEYQKRIDIAKAAGDTAEAERLSNQYLDDKQKLLDKQATTTDMILKNFKSVDSNIQDAYMNSADKLMTKKYKGTAVEDVVPLAKQAIEDSKGTTEQKYLLKMEVASGNIDPVSLVHIMDLAANDQATFNAAMNIITKFGGKDASRAQQIADLFVGQDGKVDAAVQKQFIVSVSKAKTAKEADKILDFHEQLAMSGGELDIAFLVKYFDNDPNGAGKKLQDLYAEIKNNSGNLEFNVLTKFLEPEYVGAIDKAYYDKLTANQKQVYLNEIVTVMAIQDQTTFLKDPDVQKWLSEPAKDGGGEMYAYASFPVQKQMYAQHLAGIKTAAMDATVPPVGGGGQQPGNGPSASPLDELIKKIRDLRKDQQGLTVGWTASMKAMNALFTDSKGKVRNLVPNKGQSPFNGMENQLRSKGMNQGAIDFLTGLSPEDYKKVGPKFIEIDKKTGEIRLKNAKQLNALINNIAVGEFQNSSEKMIKVVNNQDVAVKKLIAAGMSVSNAYAAVGDESFAAAIATGNFTSAQIKQMVATREQATLLQELAKRTEAVKNYFNDLTNGLKDQQTFTNLAGALKAGGYDAQTIAQILSDPTLAKGLSDELMRGSLSAEKMAAAMEKVRATTQEKITTSLKAGDFSAAFQPGYDAAQKIFDIQQRMLEQQYRPILKADEARITVAEGLVTAKQKEIDAQQKLVDIAQAEVEAANKLIEAQNTRNDKLSHDLKLMDHATEAINTKYDAQKKALDDIAKANEVISSQQKQQLTLADALSQGDIGAAAKAVQDMRAADAANAIAQQQKGLDDAQKLEIDQLRNNEGMTRLQIEAEQWKISEIIYSIQQNQLKTAQDHVDAAQAILDKRTAELVPLEAAVQAAQDQLKADQDDLAAKTEALTVMGKTKQEWEDLKLKVDAAQMAQDKLAATQLAGALATANIVDGVWTNIMDNFNSYKDKTVTITTIMQTITAGASAPTQQGTTTPTPGLTPEQQSLAKNGISAIQGLQKAGQTSAAEAATTQLMSSLAAVKPLAASDIVATRKAALGYLSSGGLVPQYFALGGYARGVDTIPAMLAPGEFVMSKYAVDQHGVNTLKAMNNGQSPSGAVYTYNLEVNVKSDANPNEIAQVVMAQIKQVDSQRLRGVRI